MQTDKLLKGSVGLCGVSILLIMAAGTEVDKQGWGGLILLLDATALAIVMGVAYIPWKKWGGVGGMRRLNFASTAKRKSVKELYSGYTRKGTA